jgi:hypothetical protein
MTKEESEKMSKVSEDHNKNGIKYIVIEVTSSMMI